MHDVTCPHCHKSFTMDEAGYADILKQVRDHEFENELQERLDLAEKDKQAALALLKTKSQSDLQLASAGKDAQIQKLLHQIEAFETEKKLAVADVVAESSSHIKDLQAQLEILKSQQQLEIVQVKTELVRERDGLKNHIEALRSEHLLAQASLKERFETQIKDRDLEIDRLRDMKARLSTKMVGESLEQHCENQFNLLRATAFPSAYFEKDNDASTGSKGDYIFKEDDDSGTEIVSIMFDMKNEAEGTIKKTRNEDHFKELDRDRREKNCEYAVLVSMLEPESDLYNAGIVDVSHRYPKMYVVRPQFFIPIITLLRNAAMGSLKYKNELALVRSQQIDVTRFEEKLESFKSGFAKNYSLASKHFEEAISEIDKSIKHLTNTKKALEGTIYQLRLANDKAQDVSIKKLTRGNPTMADKFTSLQQMEVIDEDNS